MSIKLGGSACSGTRMSWFLSSRYYFVTIFNSEYIANSGIIVYYHRIYYTLHITNVY